MPDTNYISKVTLPSVGTTGITYYIKDEEARQMISGGISFKIVWTQADYASTTAPSAAKLATIPAGVVVGYNNGANTATGTLAAAENTVAIFYLVYSKTQAGNIDTFDEFVTITNSDTTPISYFWEKIGDTQVDLSNVVTDVTLNKSTDTVIGTDATFTVTQPTVALSTGATAGTGVISVATGITSASASGDNVTALTGLGTPSTSNAVGKDATFTVTQPTIGLSSNNSTATGRVQVVTGVSGAISGYASPSSDTFLKGVKVTTQPSVTIASDDSTGDVTVATGIGSATTKYLSASASGTAVSASGDNVTVVTGYTPSTGSAASSVTPTTKKLATGSVTGVQTSTTTASKATVGTATSQTTATGGTSSSTNNTDILKGISVSNETLIFGACTLRTQTTSIPNISFADVTVPIKAASATTVATGAVTTTGSGADIVTDVAVGDTVTVLTALGTPATDTVIGTSSTFGVTQPTITLTANDSSATGRITYVQAQGTATTTKLSASASGTAVGANGTGSALTGLGTASSVSPTTTYLGASASGGNVAWNDQKTVAAITALGTPTTDTVLGTGSTITVTPTTTNIKATASNGNVAWNNKDSVTVLKDTTDVTTSRGGNIPSANGEGF